MCGSAIWINLGVDKQDYLCYIINTIRKQKEGKMAREATNRLLEMIENGEVSKDDVVMACVKYMSEDEVADMCHCNEIDLGLDEEEEEDEDWDGQPSWEQEWEDFGECYE
tara:strand:+ start:379 stop:708 length:330 start_codon:yes stop_codon:yes gene_type:complete